jgi:hypothetical protein
VPEALSGLAVDHRMTSAGAEARKASVRRSLPIVAGLTALAILAVGLSQPLRESLPGAEVSVGLLPLFAVLFVAAVIGFVAYPHLAVAGTIGLFAVLPMLRELVSSELGVVKDVVVLAAVAAAALMFLFERRSPDRPTSILVLLLLALYVFNIGGSHDDAWAHGVRLVAEPLLLLLVGLVLPDPRRTFRFAVGALIITACLVAGYGIFQQFVGKWTLFHWGYEWNQQLRVIYGDLLRSFGTLDDTFAYAALLLFGFVGVLFWLRRGPVAYGAGLLLLVGLAWSFVQTAVLVLVGLGILVLIRRGQTRAAAALTAVVVLAGGAVVATSSGSDGQSSPPSASDERALEPPDRGSADPSLSDRITRWRNAVGDDPAEWLIGRGVGEVGTGAVRATYTFERTDRTAKETHARAVDSGFIITVADVGLAGLVLLLALFARLLVLAASAARRGSSAGWVALGLIMVLLLDALTRESFTGFPTAFLGLLLIGIALAAGREESVPPPAPSQEPGG